MGMVSLRLNNGIRPELFPWLESFYVDKQHRGKGIGEKLVTEIKSKAEQLYYKELFLLTYEATLPDWHASLAWQEIGKDSLFNNPVTVMKIDLNRSSERYPVKHLSIKFGLGFKGLAQFL